MTGIENETVTGIENVIAIAIGITRTGSETVAVNVDAMTIIGMIVTELIATGEKIAIEIVPIGIATIEIAIIAAAVDGIEVKAPVVIGEEKAAIDSAMGHVLGKEVLIPRTVNGDAEICRLRLNRSYKI